MKFFSLLLPVWLLLTTPVNHITGFQIKAVEPVKIGLLITDSRSVSARHAAEMAVRKANAAGGYKGRTFQLVVRSMEGPWGTGSKQAVDLIFEEEVVALIGSCDGRNTHLVEQACAKARVVFISTWSSDPTLSQAFVPWFFNCVPNDNQQAEKLITEIYHKRKFSSAAVVTDNGYDSKMALRSFMKEASTAGLNDPVTFSYENDAADFSDLPDRIHNARVSCIVFFGQPAAAIRVIQHMQQKKINLPVFGSLSLLDERELAEEDLKGFEGADLITSGHWFTPKGKAFRKEYQGLYGELPGAVAAYAHDGAGIIIEAIRKAGNLERESIQKALAQMSYEGVTGIIQFDDKGNRTGSCNLMVIKNGVPVEEKLTHP